MMNKVQAQLLELSKRQDISKLGLRELARSLNVRNPQTIKYHLAKLREANLINESGIDLDRVDKRKLGNSDLITIPIMGSASAGPATQVADGKVEGYLKISSKLLVSSNYNDLYALEVIGRSMNEANISGQSVDDGDYVIVDSSKRSPNNNDHVVAVVDGLANIKRFILDKLNNQIVLISESTDNFMPIFVHPDDERDGLISGTVVQVIKQPKFA